MLAERYDLTGRVALVTGGTRGLGRATVRALAEAGADASFTTGAVLAVDGGEQWSLAGGGAQAERFDGSLFKGRP